MSGELVGTPNTTGVLYAVDDQDRLQGLAVTVKGGEGDRPIRSRVDYLTTAAALILTTPGIATTDPLSTIGLAVLLTSLDETVELADRLEADANRLGAEYLSRGSLTPETAAALTDAIDALSALLFSSETAMELRRRNGGSGNLVTASMLGVGQASISTDRQNVVSDSSGDDRVATAEADCSALEGSSLHEPTLRWMAWLHWLDRPTTRPRDGLCSINLAFDASTGSYAVEAMNESFWVGLAVPVTNEIHGIAYHHSDYQVLPAKSYNIPSDLIGAAATIVWETGQFTIQRAGRLVTCTVEQLQSLQSEDDSPYSLLAVEAIPGINGMVKGFKRLANTSHSPDCDGVLSFSRLMSDYAMTMADALEIERDSVIAFLVTPGGADILKAETVRMTFAIARPLGASTGDNGLDDYSSVGEVPSDVLTTARVLQVMHTLEPALLMLIDESLPIFKRKLSSKIAERQRRGITERLDAAGPAQTAYGQAISIQAPTLSEIITRIIRGGLLERIDIEMPQLKGSDEVIGSRLALGQERVQESMDSIFEEILGEKVFKRYTLWWAIASGAANSAIRGLAPFMSTGTATAVSFYTIERDIGTTGIRLGVGYPAIEVGDEYSCYHKPDATVVCWGRYSEAHPPGNIRFRQISAGRDTTCGVVQADDTIECYGHMTGEPEGPYNTVTVDDHHACGIRSDDRSVRCWGTNSWGRATPPSSGQFIDVAASVLHSCALTVEYSIMCWGKDDYGDGGQVSDAPSTGKYQEVAADSEYACAIEKPVNRYVRRAKGGGQIVCWGSDRFWIWETGRTLPPPGLFIDVAPGHQHACAIRTDLEIVCWGNDNNDVVSGAPSGQFIDISSGDWHSCALRANTYEVVCWGGNSQGQTTVPSDTMPSLLDHSTGPQDQRATNV